MARYYNFLGQDVTFGEIVGDICLYSTRLGYDSPGTYFDPIKYAEDHGGIPTSDHSYLFYDESTGDQYPVFGIYFMYFGGSKFRVGYKMRFFDESTGVWNDYPSGDPSYMPWFDRYDGADPNNITDEDRFKNGLYFTYVNIASDGAGRYTVGKIGFSLGHETDEGVAVEYPGVCTYELDEYHQNPNYETYKLTGGDSYYMFSYNGKQIDLPDFGGEWLATLATEIKEFNDDSSKPAGGGGNYQFWSDDVGMGGLPNLSIIDAGIATMWNPSPAQVQGLVDFLWSDDFFDNVIKLISDPLDNVIQFGIVPFSLSAYRGTAKEVKVGNVSTGVTMFPLKNQYVMLDLGSKEIPETWGTVMDYEPNTAVSLFLPYVGTFDLTPSEVMDCKSINITYYVDLLTGDFIAGVYINKKYPKHRLNSVMYHKAGNLMMKMPLTGANYGRMYTSILSGVAQTATSIASGNIGSVAGSVANTLVSSASVPVERTGAYTGPAAFMGCEQPYLILTQPIQVMPEKYGMYEGYPCYQTYKLSTLHGYTKCESVIDNTVDATEPEKEEIERLLKEGVIL